MSETKKTHAVKGASASKFLTVAQKAEAAALWRSGTVTLDELSKRFGKRAETFSRMFKRMGIDRGAAVDERVKEVVAKAAAAAVSDTELVIRQIAETKKQHLVMSGGIAKIAWAEIVRCRQAGVDISTLRDLMVTLKLAGDLVGNSRKEAYAILNVEKIEESSELDELPELTVRELTQTEIESIQLSPSEDDLGIDADDIGGDMLGDDTVETD